MGVSTITAGRIRKGQKNGKNGEETVTNMESLPHLALSKVSFMFLALFILVKTQAVVM